MQNTFHNILSNVLSNTLLNKFHHKVQLCHWNLILFNILSIKRDIFLIPILIIIIIYKVFQSAIIPEACKFAEKKLNEWDIFMSSTLKFIYLRLLLLRLLCVREKKVPIHLTPQDSTALGCHWQRHTFNGYHNVSLAKLSKSIIM